MPHETQVGIANYLWLFDRHPALEIVSTGPLRYDPERVIRHSTVCQILKADRVHSTAPFRIEGNEFKKIILLGNLRLCQNCTNYSDFNLDDGTGRILVRLWDRNTDLDCKPWLQLEACPYARVIGEVDNWNNSNYVTATKVEFASSPYEPYHHILQAIHDTIAYEKGPPQVISNDISGVFDSTPPSPSAPTQTSNFGESERQVTNSSRTSSAWKGKGKAMDDDFSLYREHPGSSQEICRNYEHVGDGLTNTGMQSSSLSSASSPLVPMRLQNLDIHGLYSRLPSLDRDILRCIIKERNAGSQDPWKGVYLPIIVAAVSSSRTDTLTTEEFTESLERLIEEGFIFSSIDDDHYDITLSSASDSF